MDNTENYVTYLDAQYKETTLRALVGTKRICMILLTALIVLTLLVL